MKKFSEEIFWFGLWFWRGKCEGTVYQCRLLNQISGAKDVSVYILAVCKP